MSVKSKAKKFSLSLIKASIYFLCIMLISLEAPYVHKSYLRGIAQDNVVKITSDQGSGTGFHVKSNGKTYILTNKHICDMPGPLTATMYGEKIGRVRNIIKISTKHDLCVMEALPDVEGLSISKSEIEDGESAFTLGHPRGDALNVASGEKFDNRVIQLASQAKEDGTCEEGKKIEVQTIFGPFALCVYDRASIQFSNPTYPGNSGSPVVNKYGYLVSVIFAGNQQVENSGMGVPLSYIKEFLSEVK